MFSEKLDFLMKITNTQNSVLGRAVSLDDAHISRLRSGGRALPKKQSFVAPMALFLAKAIREDYQKRAVAEVVCPDRAWPEQTKPAAALLETWMTERPNESDGGFGRLISVQRGLSLSTMPASVVKSICTRAGDTLQRVNKQSVKAFRASIDGAFVQELIALPDAEDVIEGRIPVAPDFITGAPGVCYTREEYRAHLRRILFLCERHENYRVSVSDAVAGNMLLYCKMQGGALICRQDEPQIVFTFDERSMTAALGEYLTRQSENGSDKAFAIEQIKALVNALK